MDVERREGAPRSPETGAQSAGVASSPERAPDAPREAEDDAAALESRRQAAAQAARASREMKDPALKRIELMLSAGLGDEYAKLGKEKDAFRKEGEELAQWLYQAAARGSLSSHEVLKRMEHWLLIIEARDRASDWLLQEAFTRSRRILRELRSHEMGH